MKHRTAGFSIRDFLTKNYGDGLHLSHTGSVADLFVHAVTVTFLVASWAALWSRKIYRGLILDSFNGGRNQKGLLFNYFFLDDEFNGRYQAALQFGNLFPAISIPAIFIAYLEMP